MKLDCTVRLMGLKCIALTVSARRSAVGWENIVAVNIESLFLVAAHEVNVELGYADFSQGFQLFAMLLDGADEAEAVDDFVGDEIGVVAADFAMVEVVVLSAVLHEGDE